MIAPKLIIDHLKVDAGVITQVSERLYFRHAPEESDFPLINVLPVDDSPINALSGEADLKRERVQVDVWGKTYESAYNASLVVISSLDTTAGFTVVRQSTNTSFEDDAELHRIILDFAVWHKQ